MSQQCELCEEQEKKGRHDRAHSHLVRGETSGGPSRVGRIDETEYVCSICGCEWIKETGSHGMGWVSFQGSQKI